MAHIWVVEARYAYAPNAEPHPVLSFGGVPAKIVGVHRIRESARKAARKMERANFLNKPSGLRWQPKSVTYRVAKYVREE